MSPDEEVELNRVRQNMANAQDVESQKEALSRFGGFTDSMPGEHDPVSPWLSSLPRNVTVGVLTAAVNTADQIGRMTTAAADAAHIPETPKENVVDAGYAKFRQSVIDFRNDMAKDSTTSDEITQGISQYAIPALALTKLIGGIQGVTKLGTVARVAIVDALTSALVSAPHDSRVTDILALGKHTEGKFGQALNYLTPDGNLLNKYIDWMTDRTDESDFMGTVKNVVDNLAVSAVFAGAAQALKGFGTVAKYTAENAGKGPVGRSAQKGMVGYHGTPHTFPATEKNPLGEFDLGKVGTGEGAQAYGHGIYVAERKDVAGQYKPDAELIGVHLDYMKKAVETGDGGYGPVSAEDIAYFKKIIPQVEQKLKNASLYHVDVPDEQVAKMLDWDEPLTEQGQKYIDVFRKQGLLIAGETTGRDAYDKLSKIMAGASMDGEIGQRRASAYLSTQGIPGIKYLDQGSRAKGKGTRNLVLFDPKIAKIIKKE